MGKGFTAWNMCLRGGSPLARPPGSHGAVTAHTRRGRPHIAQDCEQVGGWGSGAGRAPARTPHKGLLGVQRWGVSSLLGPPHFPTPISALAQPTSPAGKCATFTNLFGQRKAPWWTETASGRTYVAATTQRRAANFRARLGGGAAHGGLRATSSHTQLQQMEQLKRSCTPSRQWHTGSHGGPTLESGTCGLWETCVRLSLVAVARANWPLPCNITPPTRLSRPGHLWAHGAPGPTAAQRRCQGRRCRCRGVCYPCPSGSRVHRGGVPCRHA